ncbi:MAG: hypothetical protein Q9165_007265 [Trypethelium subeluteriae]
MNRSAGAVSVQQIPEDHFLRCVELAVAYNADLVPPHSANAMLYIRPFVFGSGPWFQLSPTDEYFFGVYVVPISALHGVQPIDALILDEFDRAATRGVGSAKVGGNYAPVMRWSEKAKQEGYPITLHLDSQTQTEIEEFTTSAFVGITRTGSGDNIWTTLVVPDSRNIVESVTSDSIQQIARSLGWNVERRSVRKPLPNSSFDTIKYAELAHFSEVLACGTGVSVVPIRSISRNSTSDKFVYLERASEPGPSAKMLADSISKAYKGAVEDRFWWLYKVKEPNVKPESDALLKSDDALLDGSVKANGNVKLNGK